MEVTTQTATAPGEQVGRAAANGFARKVVGRIDRMVGIGRETVRLYSVTRQQTRPHLTAPDEVRWEWLQPGDADRLLDIFPLPEDLETRLSRPDACLLGSVEGRLAFYGWIQGAGIHPMTHAARRRPVRSAECWIYNCRTAEWARGRGIYPAALTRMLDEQFASGIATAWIYASAWNVASLKGIEKAGFRLADTLRAVRVGERYFRAGRP